MAPSAERALERFPEKVAAAVVEFMLGPLLDSPHQVGYELQRELKGLWSARRGSYRIVYEIKDEERQVHVVWIYHRADVYRPR